MRSGPPAPSLTRSRVSPWARERLSPRVSPRVRTCVNGLDGPCVSLHRPTRASRDRAWASPTLCNRTGLGSFDGGEGGSGNSETWLFWGCVFVFPPPFFIFLSAPTPRPPAIPPSAARRGREGAARGGAGGEIRPGAAAALGGRNAAPTGGGARGSAVGETRGRGGCRTPCLSPPPSPAAPGWNIPAGPELLLASPPPRPLTPVPSPGHRAVT